MVLLGNKSDLQRETVPEKLIKNFCKTNDISIFKPTSAKTGEGVSEAFL